MMNKVKNKRSIPAMRWGKMCIQNIPWNSTTNNSPIVVKNTNVWTISKYHDFL
jgi:hypothetical protein